MNTIIWIYPNCRLLEPKYKILIIVGYELGYLRTLTEIQHHWATAALWVVHVKRCFSPTCFMFLKYTT